MNDDETDHPAERAYDAETVIVAERGQWAVDVVVIFADEVVRKRIATYRTERQAQIAANWIGRAARRDITGPVNG